MASSLPDASREAHLMVNSALFEVYPFLFRACLICFLHFALYFRKTVEASTLTGWQGASITPFLVMGVQIALRLEGPLDFLNFFINNVHRLFYEALSLIFN